MITVSVRNDYYGAEEHFATKKTQIYFTYPIKTPKIRKYVRSVLLSSVCNEKITVSYSKLANFFPFPVNFSIQKVLQESHKCNVLFFITKEKEVLPPANPTLLQSGIYPGERKKERMNSILPINVISSPQSTLM